MAAGVRLELRRAPRTDDELWLLIKVLWGVEIPRVQVCPDHVAPFTAVAHAYFGREPGFAVWYASRGSGKSLALAILGLTKAFVDDVKVTILGGSMTQSQNVSAHMKDHLEYPNAPLWALKGGKIEKGVTATQISLQTGVWIRPIPASQTTVRGPHPPLTLLDEVDEMDYDIFVASLGQAMEQLNSRGELIGEYIVASSTWQNPIGTFTRVIEDARKKGQPIFTWCWRELLKTESNPTGWMSQRFIDRKRSQVTAEMWRTEYELNEPSGDSRAFDLTVLEEQFQYYPNPIDYIENGEDDQTWIWEKPEHNGSYAVGADWAQEKDKTVIAIVRYDVTPRRLVKLRRVNRQPYPVMMKTFDEAINEYNAAGRHDRTGLGRVVSNFLESEGDDRVAGFDFSGKKKRSQMLLAYVNAVENRQYVLPRGGPEYKVGGGFLAEFHKGHRGTTQANIYGNHKDNGQGMSDAAGHLPDDVAAMALAHLAASAVPATMQAQGVPVDRTPRAVDKPFHVKPYDDDQFILAGPDVTIVDDRYEAPIADFGFSELSI